MASSINDFLADLGERANRDLREAVEVREVDDFPEKDEVESDRVWLRIDDVVAVVADLKNSTAVSFKKHPQTSAKLYEAVTGNCTRIVSRFDADFVDIQGDGLFALYHGERAYERALCAGITLKTFSQKQLVPAIEGWEQRRDQFPETGLKVGMHSGVLAVKRVGVKSRTHEWKEPVWAGRPVNWAFKCAQLADANELVCTKSVYGMFEDNDYVTHSCGCRAGGEPTVPSNAIWNDFDMQGKLPADKAPTKVLVSAWCDTHGDEFCEAILNGEKNRDDVTVSGFAGV
jgi:class 3 adenylate cyclase